MFRWHLWRITASRAIIAVIINTEETEKVYVGDEVEMLASSIVYSTLSYKISSRLCIP